MAAIAVFLLLPLFLSRAAAATSTEDLLSELRSRRSAAPSGVIRLTDAAVSRYISDPSARPYAILIFFDAKQFHSRPELSLPRHRREFSLLSSAFAAEPHLFFADIEFADAQQSFRLFGVESLPHARLLLPEHRHPKDSEPMPSSQFSSLAEGMRDFVSSRLGIPPPEIIRPPPLSRMQLAILSILGLISLPFSVKRLIQGGTFLHDKRVWAAGAVFVYFFSVGGLMHGVIKSSPLFLADHKDPDNLVFFYKGSGMQLGAEGFAVGSLYTIVGLIIAFVTHCLVRVEYLVTRRWCIHVMMLVACMAVSKVASLDHWKTGYRIHAYWPNRWR